jgi:hypothetical protein
MALSAVLADLCMQQIQSRQLLDPRASSELTTRAGKLPNPIRG